MSGAGNIKGDYSTDEHVIEHKVARKQYALKLSDIKAIWRHAVHNGKDSIMVIEFDDGYTATIHIDKE
jgi:hypothetical protein